MTAAASIHSRSEMERKTVPDSSVGKGGFCGGKCEQKHTPDTAEVDWSGSQLSQTGLQCLMQGL